METSNKAVIAKFVMNLVKIMKEIKSNEAIDKKRMGQDIEDKIAVPETSGENLKIQL